MKNSHTKGLILIGLATLIWGTNGIFARLINLPTPILLFFRYGIGFIILLVYFLFKDKKSILPHKNRKGILILGFFNVLLSLTAFYAFTNTSIANAEILMYSYPLYLLILAPLLIREKIDKSSLLPMGLSFLGLVFISFSSNMLSPNQNVGGLIAGFLSGVTFALYILAAKKVSASYDGLVMNLHQLAVTTVILLPGLFLIPYSLDAGKVILLFYMGFFNSALAASLYFRGVKLIKVQHVGIISYLEPLSAVIFAFILFQEVPSLLTVLGGILILYGGYRITIGKK